MAKNYIEINGRTFELIDSIPPVTPCFKHLYDIYHRPSETKLAIFYGWEKWFDSVGSWDSGAISGNSNFYTHGGDFEYKGVRYRAIITYAHNRLYRLP